MQMFALRCVNFINCRLNRLLNQRSRISLIRPSPILRTNRLQKDHTKSEHPQQTRHTDKHASQCRANKCHFEKCARKSAEDGRGRAPVHFPDESDEQM